MPISDIKFKMTDEKYKQGAAIDEYKGRYSIISAVEGQDGQIWPRWVYPQKRVDSQSVPGDKVIPMQVLIGNDRAEAIETLKHFLYILGENQQTDDIPF